ADGETRGDSHGARVPDENGVEIGAVAAPRFARVVDVTAPPPLAGFVVLHRGNDVVVDGARHFEIGVRIRLFDYFASPGADLVVERNQPVRAQVAGEFLGVFVVRERRSARQARLYVLFARSVEAQFEIHRRRGRDDMNHFVAVKGRR